MRGSRDLQRANIEAARLRGQALIKQDQTDKENETAKRQIDGDFPGGGHAIAAPPNSNKQKSGNQREFVKGVKEKQIERRKRAERATRYKQQTGIECVFVIVDFACEPDAGQGHDGSEQDQNETETVKSGREMNSPALGNREGIDELKAGFPPRVVNANEKRHEQCNAGR